MMTMGPHISSEELRSFKQRESSGADVERVARHLAACEQCRDAGAANLVSAIVGPQEHLTFEEIAGIVELGPAEKSHARTCRVCSREIADLREFRRRPAKRWIPFAAAAVLVLLAGGGGLVVQGQRRDARLAEVPFPAAALAMQGRHRSFRGVEASARLDVIEPRNSVVVSDRPTFRWNASSDAPCVVEIFGPDFERVARSGPLTSRSWIVSERLTRGVHYRWQVTCGTTVIPAPPLPSAVFMIAAADQANEILTLERSTRRPSLELAAAYSRAGDFKTARSEVHWLLRENPRHRAATRLLHRIDSVTR